MAERFYDGMPGPEIRRELNEVYDFMADSMVAPTSSTSLTVGTGEKTLTIESDKALGVGQSVRIARTSDPLTWMDGVVTSYAGTTLKVLVSDSAGSGTYSDWTVTAAGATGPQGEVGWSPVLAVISDGARRVFEVTDWVGGQGQKPALGYIGATGIVPNIGSAIDVRGSIGQTGPANSLSIGTVQSGAADASITGDAPSQTLNLTLPKGDMGDDGWSPIIVLESDGDRRVLKIDDWTGGSDTKPGTGYIGASGIVQDKANAVNIRGSIGQTGPANSLSIGTVQGGTTADATITGNAPTQTLNLTLPKGDAGDDGWSPVPGSEDDGERRVLKVVDWTGGQGTKPSDTGYFAPSGLVPDKSQATDFRGAPGSGSVSTVNSKDPDGEGNVDIGIDDIPGLDDALDDAGKVKTVAGQAPDAQGNVELSASDIGLGNVTNHAQAKATTKIEGTGALTGGGTLAANRTIDASAATKTSLSRAETAFGWGDHASAGYATSSALTSGLAGKVDKVAGKGLSAEDYTTNDKNKLAGIAAGATNTAAPVNADWNASSGLAEIKNKPTIPSLDGYATQSWVEGKGYVTTDTTYATGTKAHLDAGSDTTVRVYTPKVLADWLSGKSYATTTQLAGKFDTPTGTTAQYIRGDGTLASFPNVPSEASKANIAAGLTNNFISPANITALADDPGTISGGASNTFNWAAALNYTMSLTGNRTLSNPTNVQPGTTRAIIVQASTSVARTLAFGGNFVGDLTTVSVTNTSRMVLFLYAISSSEVVVSGIKI